MNESRAMVVGAMAGALIGAAAGYLFFTEAGRSVRDRIEPAVDDLRREFARFQKTVKTASEMAADGVRVVNEFNAARAQPSLPDMRTSH